MDNYHLLKSKQIGAVEKTTYSCPCGNGYIEEEQDYTPGHRDAFVQICCSRCQRVYAIKYSESGLSWSIVKIRDITPMNIQNMGGKSMKLSNVFYFKNIVDAYYPDEDRDAVDIQAIVTNLKTQIQTLSDSDFIEVMISCFIPDLYSGMGKCEKLFTKLTELMVGEWWRRLGGTYYLPTKKSGTEDVELKYEDISIVCDAKVFRLGRSQKAPNVKDFLKLASVALWIKSHEDAGRKVIGGLVTYSSLHEWESDSEVYEECTNHITPVVMIPYEVMALLLKYKDNVFIPELLKIWNYAENDVVTSRQKDKYWKYITKRICDIAAIDEDIFKQEMKEYHRCILQAVAEYRRIVQETIDATKTAIINELSRFENLDELKEYTATEIVRRDNATAIDYLKRIDDFRRYKDQD